METKSIDQLIPVEYQWKNTENLLYSIYEYDSPGITIPQFYVKTEGSFTSVHQETMSLESVNVNLGPS